MSDHPVTDPDPSGDALRRYAATLRRRRTRYYSVLAAVVVVLGLFVAVTWSRGEVANTALHPVSDAPVGLSVSTPSANLQAAWRTADRAALGVPQWRGTVVVYSRHTVRGLNARTGAQTWSYTRTNRSVCWAVQANGTTFAVFMVNGNCDEVTGLDSGLGTRRWTRTLDGDGLPVNGRPAVSVVPSTVMFTTSTVIYAIDPDSGYNRWTYSRPGCTIERAVLGSAGALISQSCTAPQCSGQKFCAKGPQLLLRDQQLGRDDKSTTNPDHILWAKRGDTEIPVCADLVVCALDASAGRLSVLSSSDGAVTGEVALPAQPGSPDTVALAAGQTEVIYLRGFVYAVTFGTTAPLWSATASGPPTVVDAAGQDDPDIESARITVPTSRGVAELDGTSGKTARSSSIPVPAAGATVRPFGTGYLVDSTTGTIAYR